MPYKDPEKIKAYHDKRNSERRKTIDLPYKRCGTCGNCYPKTLDFFRKKSALGGLKSDCRICFDEKSRARHVKNYADNKEREDERIRLVRLKFKDKFEATAKAYRQKNKEKIKNKDAERILILPDTYIIQKVREQTGLSKEDILANPDIIATKRLIIQLKRTIKTTR